MNNKTSLKFFSLSTPIKGAVRYPLTKVVFGPYVSLFTNFKFFCYVACFFTLFISLTYLLCGQSLYCYFGQFAQERICSINPLIFIGSRIMVLYLISMFCVRYYQIVWQGKLMPLKQMLKPALLDVKSFVFIVAFLIINSIAIGSWYLLKIRVPNPDWRIELCYFGIVGLGILVPFILLRFYSVFASIWSGEKISGLFGIWQKSRGNNLSLILSIGLLIFLWSISSSLFWGEFGAISSQVSYWGIFISEYLYNFATLAIIACFVNNCALQQSFLQKDISSERA